MKTIVIVAGVFLLIAGPVQAGCIGPVIMGVCQGQQVPWDTHPDAGQVLRPSPPPGWIYDRRQEPAHQDHVNPFTGQDANDPDWFNLTPAQPR